MRVCHLYERTCVWILHSEIDTLYQIMYMCMWRVVGMRCMYQLMYDLEFMNKSLNFFSIYMDFMHLFTFVPFITCLVPTSLEGVTWLGRAKLSFCMVSWLGRFNPCSFFTITCYEISFLANCEVVISAQNVWFDAYK